MSVHVKKYRNILWTILQQIFSWKFHITASVSGPCMWPKSLFGLGALFLQQAATPEETEHNSYTNHIVRLCSHCTPSSRLDELVSNDPGILTWFIFCFWLIDTRFQGICISHVLTITTKSLLAYICPHQYSLSIQGPPKQPPQICPHLIDIKVPRHFTI